MNRKYTLLLFLGLLLFSASCKKFEGSQKVPAYIHIESVEVDSLTDYFVYGANTHKITDAWVHVDDQLIGVFELPATFPVLKRGPHEVTIYGGIMVDGRSSARDRYPFYQTWTVQNLDLVEDSIINLSPVLSYYPIGDNLNVAWMEDFENTNTLLSDTSSAVNMNRVSGVEAWQSVNSFWSGKVELPPDSLDFTVVTADQFDFYRNTNGVYCLLEMDYNCNDTFLVGIQYYLDYYLETLPIIKVTPTDKTHDKPERWNKIYINIGPYMNDFQRASYFKLFFTSNLAMEGSEYHPISEPRYFFFDNLKLLYRNFN